MKNRMWNNNQVQVGTISNVLGKVNQLFVDNCLLEEVRKHKENPAVAYYDYQKAFDKVHHNWMVKVCTWMEYPENFVKIIGTMMEKWRTRLEVCRDKKTEISI